MSRIGCSAGPCFRPLALVRMATGSYNAFLAAAFLGVTAEGFSGGRLSHYLSKEEDADEIARELWKLIGRLKDLSDSRPEDETYELLLSLTEAPLLRR